MNDFFKLYKLIALGVLAIYLAFTLFVFLFTGLADLSVILILLGVLLAVLFAIGLSNPYVYPYKVVKIDISGRRKVDAEEEVEKYLLENGMSEFTDWLPHIDAWKQETREHVDRALFRKLRTRQFVNVVDDGHAFRFELMRQQTRYRQTNYIRTPYTVETVSDSYSCDYGQLKKLFRELADIGFETTTRRYGARNQRRNMTPELRRFIAERDDYTCQICGKRMPDRVGLEIDHIVPVSKGGKTVPSNLRVLCSRCNRRKADKILEYDKQCD